MYCSKCDGEGVGVWNGEYVTCKYCGGTGIYQDDEEEDMLWESYYEQELIEPASEESEWYDYSEWIDIFDPF